MEQCENLTAVTGAHNGLIGYGVIPVNEAGKSLAGFRFAEKEIRRPRQLLRDCTTFRSLRCLTEPSE